MEERIEELTRAVGRLENALEGLRGQLGTIEEYTGATGQVVGQQGLEERISQVEADITGLLSRMIKAENRAKALEQGLERTQQAAIEMDARQGARTATLKRRIEDLEGKRT